MIQWSFTSQSLNSQLFSGEETGIVFVDVWCRTLFYLKSSGLLFYLSRGESFVWSNYLLQTRPHVHGSPYSNQGFFISSPGPNHLKSVVGSRPSASPDLFGSFLLALLVHTSSIGSLKCSMLQHWWSPNAWVQRSSCHSKVQKSKQ